MTASNSNSVEFDGADVSRVAALMDRAAAERSPYRRFLLAEGLFLPGDQGAWGRAPEQRAQLEDIDELDHDDHPLDKLPLLDRAAWAAMRYHPVITVNGSKERIRLEPHFKGPDGSDPADTGSQEQDVVSAWVTLAGAVETPAARVTLSHLVFQANGPEARCHAQAASRSYLQLAESESRVSDAVDAARASVRLARAVGDQELRAEALEALQVLTEKCLSGERKSVKAAKAGLGTLVHEKSTQGRRLVEIACATWGPGDAGQAFWQLKLETASGEADRIQIWRDRVESAIQIAEGSSSNIVKAARLGDALALAEASGIAELRERAAVLVQRIRGTDLEMALVKASSHQFDEQFELMVAWVLGDPAVGDFTVEGKPATRTSAADADADLPSWCRRLWAFAHSGPPTGNPDENRELIANQSQLAPLLHLFPMQLVTPDGLPLFTAETEEERLDLEMVRWETQLLQQWAYVYAEALHRVVDPDLPSLEGLVRFLIKREEDSPVCIQLAQSFYRYWAGDGQAALHTALPMIEALVRNAVCRADRGVYRMQKKQTPGQFVGLGVLLDLFCDSYQVSEADQRFFNATLKHPGGWNLRNLTSHGYLPGADGSVAAITLYAALRVLILTANGSPEKQEDNQDAGQGDDSIDGA
jgi:hypothetical protein